MHVTWFLGAALPDSVASLLLSHTLAYIDPGTGSMVVQVLIGAVVGALVTMKLYWQRIKAFFARRGSSEDPRDGAQ